MWGLIGVDSLEEYLDNISNLVEVFASGPFPLFQGRVERISMSELHSYDPLEGLSSSEHTAPALYELKRIVQVIYEKDYRFAQPPKMPTLTATAGDSKVILTWDDVADTKTRDPFVGNINDLKGIRCIGLQTNICQIPKSLLMAMELPCLKTYYQCDLVR